MIEIPVSFYLPQCRVLHANNREAIDPWFPLYSILPDRAPCLRSRISLSPSPSCSSSSSSSSRGTFSLVGPGPGGVPSHTRSLPPSAYILTVRASCVPQETRSLGPLQRHTTTHVLLMLALHPPRTRSSFCPLPTAYFPPRDVAVSLASGHRHFHRQFRNPSEAIERPSHSLFI